MAPYDSYVVIGPIRGSTNVAVTEGHGEFPVAKVKDAL
jgi:hypothetical protein